MKSAIPAAGTEGPAEAPPKPRNLVLCFDGTGNKYKGDGTDTNILKIFHMLDKNAKDQCTFAPPPVRRLECPLVLTETTNRSLLSA